MNTQPASSKYLIKGFLHGRVTKYSGSDASVDIGIDLNSYHISKNPDSGQVFLDMWYQKNKNPIENIYRLIDHSRSHPEIMEGMIIEKILDKWQLVAFRGLGLSTLEKDIDYREISEKLMWWSRIELVSNSIITFDNLDDYFIFTFQKQLSEVLGIEDHSWIPDPEWINTVFEFGWKVSA